MLKWCDPFPVVCAKFNRVNTHHRDLSIIKHQPFIPTGEAESGQVNIRACHDHDHFSIICYSIGQYLVCKIAWFISNFQCVLQLSFIKNIRDLFRDDLQPVVRNGIFFHA